VIHRILAHIFPFHLALAGIPHSCVECAWHPLAAVITKSNRKRPFPIPHPLFDLDILISGRGKKMNVVWKYHVAADEPSSTFRPDGV
jgi:hypothetical protein